MKLLKLMVVVLLCISCTEQKETYHITESGKRIVNSGVPAQPNLQIKLEKLFCIDSGEDGHIPAPCKFQMPFDLNVDSRGRIYVLDIKRGNIGCFAADGTYLSSFGRRGSGPGEFQAPNSLALVNDTIYVNDEATKKISLFTCGTDSVKYIRSFPVSYFQFLKSAGSNFIVYEKSFDQEREMINNSAVLYDKSFKHKVILNSIDVTLREYKTPGFNYQKVVPIYASFQDKLYLAKTSDSEFEVIEYSTTGKEICKIKKKYMKVLESKEELAEFNQFMKEVSGGLNQEVANRYKQSITGLLVDGEGRVWVKRATDREKTKNSKVYFDIFKDGKFLNSISFDDIEGSDNIDLQRQIFIFDNRLYYMDNVNMKIDIYLII